MKEDAPRVIKIPAKPEATRQAEARRQLRVAAYCRVSTKEEDLSLIHISEPTGLGMGS